MTCKIATFIEIKLKNYHMGKCREKMTITSFDCVKLDEFFISSTIIAAEPTSLGSV
jgi:hypothetical protein